MLMMKLIYVSGNQSLVFLIFIILEAKAWVTRKTEIHPMTEIVYAEIRQKNTFVLLEYL